MSLAALALFAAAASAEDRKPLRVKVGAPADASSWSVGSLSEIAEVEPNDFPSEAQPLTCGDALSPASLVNAAGRDSDWVAFSAGAGMLITLATGEVGPGPETDTVVDLIASDGTTSLAVNDDYGGSSYASIVNFVAPYGGTYYGRIRGFQGAEGSYRADLACTPAPEAPANDACAGAFTILCGSVALSGYSHAAANDYDLCPGSPLCESSCTGFASPGRDVVLRIDVPAAGVQIEVTYDIVPAAADAAVYLVTDCGNVAATCVAGADGEAGYPPETLSYVFTAAGVYYLILDAFESDAGGAWTLAGTLSCATRSAALTWGALKAIYR